MKKFNKVLAFVLSLCLMLSFVTVIGYADDFVENTTEYPIIYICGDGSPIYDTDENQVYPTGFDTSELPEIVKDVVFPHLVNALFKGEWEGYYDAFEKAINDIFEKAHLDDNGEASNGTAVNKGNAESSMDYRFSDRYYRSDEAEEDGYALKSYKFQYDWRLDPYFNADRLEKRVDQLANTFGTDKVNLYVHCLGGTMLMAYLERYGSDKINAIFADSCILNGSELVGDMFTGDIRLDGASLERFVDDWGDKFDDEPGKEMIVTVIGMLKNLIVLMNATDGIAGVDSLFQMFYSHIKTELVPRLIMATFGTFPNYWDLVPADKYQEAKDYVFNTPEKMAKYAGIIEKSDLFHERVLSDYESILTKALENGTRIGAMSKYGYQTVPVSPTADMIGDDTVTVASSGFGTTTAKNITSTFDKDYIEKQTKAGLTKYISPDKQIDASTSLIKDQIWYEKGSKHVNFKQYNELKMKFFNSNGTMTVNDDPNWPQFLVYDKKTDTVKPMTEKNCQPNEYESGKDNTPGLMKLIQNFAQLMSKILKMLMNLFDKIFFNKINTIFSKGK